MTFRREELAEGIVIYNADCREVLPTLPRVDAVVTDPPYGIGIKYEERYYDIGRRRISDALKSPDLFIQTPKPAKQEELL